MQLNTTKLLFLIPCVIGSVDNAINGSMEMEDYTSDVNFTARSSSFKDKKLTMNQHIENLCPCYSPVSHKYLLDIV